MSERLGVLFWIAVAVLATRAVWEVAGACRLLGRLTLRAARAARRRLPARGPGPRVPPDPAPAPAAAPRSNYLETLSAEEMDRLLGPGA